MNVELEQMTNSADLDPVGREDGLAALRQLPAPAFALDSLHAILSAMARSVVAVEPGKPDTLNLVSMYSILFIKR